MSSVPKRTHRLESGTLLCRFVRPDQLRGLWIAEEDERVTCKLCLAKLASSRAWEGKLSRWRRARELVDMIRELGFGDQLTAAGLDDTTGARLTMAGLEELHDLLVWKQAQERQGASP